MDVGRGLAAIDASDHTAAAESLARALEHRLRPLLEQASWKLTIFCGAAAMRSPGLVETLASLPKVSLGVRYFAEEGPRRGEGRGRQILALADQVRFFLR